MKRIMIMCGLISIMNVACAQQTHKPPRQRAENRTVVLEKQLNLSTQQVKKVKAIMLVQATRIDSLKNVQQEIRMTRRLQRRKILAQTDERMANVLTADQNAEYLKWKKLKKENHKRKAENAG